jgi:hypothetical protein
MPTVRGSGGRLSESAKRGSYDLRFITGSQHTFVVEDADHLLRPRAKGNENLHRFLAIADGVVRSQECTTGYRCHRNPCRTMLDRIPSVQFISP